MSKVVAVESFAWALPPTALGSKCGSSLRYRLKAPKLRGKGVSYRERGRLVELPIAVERWGQLPPVCSVPRGSGGDAPAA